MLRDSAKSGVRLLVAIVLGLVVLPSAAAEARPGLTPVVLFPAYHLTRLRVDVNNQTVAPECPRSGSFEYWFQNPNTSAFSQMCQDQLLTLRFDAEEGDRLLALLHERLPEVLAKPGIVGAHLCLADKGASSVKTEEKKSRPTAALVPGWVVLVEGGAERERLERASDEVLDERSLVAAGAKDLQRGVYALQVSLSR